MRTLNLSILPQVYYISRANSVQGGNSKSTDLDRVCIEARPSLGMSQVPIFYHSSVSDLEGSAV